MVNKKQAGLQGRLSSSYQTRKKKYRLTILERNCWDAGEYLWTVCANKCLQAIYGSKSDLLATI